MIAPLLIKTIYKKPKIKEQCQYDEYLKSVYESRPLSSTKSYTLVLASTLIASVLFFYLFGPDQARINNNLILRKNSAQIIEYIYTVNHLISPV